jgi:hypothetical protein
MICTCPAYQFPHREGGGDCGARWETVRDPYGTHDLWYTRTEMVEPGSESLGFMERSESQIDATI